MEFTITCPVDGPVEVGLEDIDNVVLRESDHADITFTCPHCGSRISVTAIVPAFLLTAIEALAEDSEGEGHGFVVVPTPVSDQVVDGSASVMPGDSQAEAYCEYFRRQLEHVECVDDALREMDQRT